MFFNSLNLCILNIKNLLEKFLIEVASWKLALISTKITFTNILKQMTMNGIKLCQYYFDVDRKSVF